METISLKEHFESKIAEIRASVTTAYTSMEKRLEGMNEFRATLKDQNAQFITREEYSAKFEGVQKQLDTLKEQALNSVTRDELNLIVDRLKEDIKNLQLAKAVLEGKASQQSVNIALMISAIGIIIGIVNIILRFL